MELTLVALGNKTTPFIAEILAAVSSCKCQVVELRSSRLAQTTASYLLIEGDWNHIAKLESVLDALQKRLEITINTLRPESKPVASEGIAYTLETISVNRNDIIESITNFLLERDIGIEEMNASCYQAPYIQTPIFATKFIVLIPPQVRLLALREEFLDYCDNLNIDAIIEPIKR
jgi:glycine cleavage system transcriptional repressor